MNPIDLAAALLASLGTPPTVAAAVAAAATAARAAVNATLINGTAGPNGSNFATLPGDSFVSIVDEVVCVELQTAGDWLRPAAPAVLAAAAVDAGGAALQAATAANAAPTAGAPAAAAEAAAGGEELEGAALVKWVAGHLPAAHREAAGRAMVEEMVEELEVPPPALAAAL